MIDYTKFKMVYHKQQNKFGTIVKYHHSMTPSDYILTELDIDWDNGGTTHLYASQYLGKFLDRFTFYEHNLDQKEKLAIMLKNIK